MGHRDVFTAADAVFMPIMGEAAIYTPSGGAAVACYVFIDFNVMLQPSGVDAQVWEQGTTIKALLSDITNEPNRGDVFVVDGVTYTVQAILENDGLAVKVVVK
jgi:hypothetical protein